MGLDILWVDLYSQSDHGKLDSTVDIVTKDGSYQFPLNYEDLCTLTNGTTSRPDYVGLSLNNGCEVRFKGITSAECFIQLTDVFSHTLSSDTHWTSPTRASIPAECIELTGTNTNTKGAVLFVEDLDSMGGAGVGGVLWPLDFITIDGDGCKAYAAGALVNCMTALGTNTTTPKLINPDYYINPFTDNSGYAYMFNALPISIKVTCGWLTETTRGGHTPVIHEVNQTPQVWIARYTGNNYLGECHWDCPEMLWTTVSKIRGTALQDRLYTYFSGKNLVHRMGHLAQFNNTLSIKIDRSSDLHIESITTVGSTFYLEEWNAIPGIARFYIDKFITGSAVTLYSNPAEAEYHFRAFYNGKNNSAGSLNATTTYRGVYFSADGILSQWYDGKLITTAGAIPEYVANIPGTVTNTWPGQRTRSGVPEPSSYASVDLNIEVQVETIADGVEYNPGMLGKMQYYFYAASVNTYHVSEFKIYEDYRNITLEPFMLTNVLTGKGQYTIRCERNTFDGAPIDLCFSNTTGCIISYFEKSKGAVVYQGNDDAVGEIFYRHIPMTAEIDFTSGDTKLSIGYETSAGFDGTVIITPVAIDKVTGEDILLPTAFNSGANTLTINTVNTTPVSHDYTIPASFLSVDNAIGEIFLKLEIHAPSGNEKFFLRNTDLTEV